MQSQLNRLTTILLAVMGKMEVGSIAIPHEIYEDIVAQDVHLVITETETDVICDMLTSDEVAQLAQKKLEFLN